MYYIIVHILLKPKQHTCSVLFKTVFYSSCSDEKFLSSSNSDLPHSDQVVSVACKQGL